MNKMNRRAIAAVVSIVLVMMIGLAALMTSAWVLQDCPPLELSLVSDFARPANSTCEVDSEFIEMLMDQTVYIRNASGTGSGVIIDSENGLVLTAGHGQCDEMTSYVYLNDGRVYTVEPNQATVYPAFDLAVLDIGEDLLVAVSPINEDYPDIGDEIIVIGSPVGWEYFNTVSFGRISGLLRRVEGVPHLFWYQTDANINRGNSGGPWFDTNGCLIAITLRKAYANGISLGLPIRYLAEAREEAQKMPLQLSPSTEISMPLVPKDPQNILIRRK